MNYVDDVILDDSNKNSYRYAIDVYVIPSSKKWNDKIDVKDKRYIGRIFCKYKRHLDGKAQSAVKLYNSLRSCTENNSIWIVGKTKKIDISYNTEINED